MGTQRAFSLVSHGSATALRTLRGRITRGVNGTLTINFDISNILTLGDGSQNLQNRISIIRRFAFHGVGRRLRLLV